MGATRRAKREGGGTRGVGEELLARVPLFAGLPESALASLAESLATRTFAPDELLIQEGDLGEAFYIVREGRIEVLKAVGTPEEQVLARRGPGEFIGEMSLLNPDGLRTASVRAASPTTAWVMTQADFDSLLHKYPRLAYDMVRVLSERLRDAHELSIASLQTKNAELLQAYDALKAAQAQIIEKEKLEHELGLARSIQLSLLPQALPEAPGVEFGARLVTARQVGGDFYDLFPLEEGSVGLMIGDVTDKGVPAAIFMAQVRALLRAGARRRRSAEEALREANERLLEMNARNLFVTALYGVLDVGTRRLAYARAGHELPLLCHADGRVESAPLQTGQPLGILEAPEFDVQTIEVPARGLLLLHTDGISDARNAEGEGFGRERLLEHAGSLVGLGAQAACDRMVDSVVGFIGEAQQEDDFTLVAVG